MKNQKIIVWLTVAICILALFAAGMGLFYQHSGEPYEFTNHRGETVMINGQGLYFYDTVSSAAQVQGNDLVTLVIAIPLLIISLWLMVKGSLRGHLLFTGTTAYFLYTYMSIAMLTAFNSLFLVYTGLFSLSLFTFILSIKAFDVEALAERFSEKTPRGWIAGLLFLVGLFIMTAWLGRIIPPMMGQQIAPLENTTTFVIQVMDIALVFPLVVISGILLLRKNGWGYLLASISLLKGVTLGLGVCAMAINMFLQGVGDSMAIVVPFFVITLLAIVFSIMLLRNVKQQNL